LIAKKNNVVARTKSSSNELNHEDMTMVTLSLDFVDDDNKPQDFIDELVKFGAVGGHITTLNGPGGGCPNALVTFKNYKSAQKILFKTKYCDKHEATTLGGIDHYVVVIGV
jgi:hypothetical protein